MFIIHSAVLQLVEMVLGTMCGAKLLPQSYEKSFFGPSVVVVSPSPLFKSKNKGRKIDFSEGFALPPNYPTYISPHACVQLRQHFSFFIFEKSKLKIALDVGSITSCVYHTASSILLEVLLIVFQPRSFSLKRQYFVIRKVLWGGDLGCAHAVELHACRQLCRKIDFLRGMALFHTGIRLF